MCEINGVFGIEFDDTVLIIYAQSILRHNGQASGACSTGHLRKSLFDTILKLFASEVR